VVGLKISFAEKHPELISEWHPTKNDNLTPYDVSYGSGKIVWWIYPYDDPITGKHFDFEWEATILSRNQGNGCPQLSGKKVVLCQYLGADRYKEKEVWRCWYDGFQQKQSACTI
jgi:hypothetical protein